MVIGAGPGGICSGHYLRQAGYDEFTIFERDGDVGGTWQRNRYPGLACDVWSHVYCFTFALNPSWSRSYAAQPEILEYMRKTVTDLDLWPHIRLNTGIASAAWDDDHGVWRVTTQAGEEVEADAVISAQGMFGELKYPDIEGRDTFAGAAMHTGAWDESVDLTGRRVAVIGSAASAVQSIPEIAKAAGQLHVFQRSANWVLPKEDVEHTDEQLEQFLDPEELQAYHDGIMTFLGPSAPFSNPEINAIAEWVAACAIEVVDDPVVRRKLTPTTPWGCLRPLFSNDYYPTFNRSNVELVTDPIARITPNGVVTADGVEREVDVIVFATGYEVDKFASRIPITGRGGLTLREAWADGAQAHLGITTSGFPNLFMLYGPNTNQGSLIPMIEYEAQYAVKALQAMDAAGVDWVDVKPEVMAAYNDELQAAIDGVEVWKGGCSHYYLSESGRMVTQYPWSMYTFRESVAEPNLDDFELGRRHHTSPAAAPG
ncbi:flavin-containing monooxygenase [Rhabdothermincola salaria]|uniref:flavin-containing monooxygenase n=1 Tax=Rhabdothermincola salaria TaxID=2903142 RepID=UPI001E58C344|nr:NAD(P)/FAD-dependent oxidoreductase [Rhabdothermincola salaria]